VARPLASHPGLACASRANSLVRRAALRLDDASSEQHDDEDDQRSHRSARDRGPSLKADKQQRTGDQAKDGGCNNDHGAYTTAASPRSDFTSAKKSGSGLTR
jgi:hypothetical protein